MARRAHLVRQGAPARFLDLCRRPGHRSAQYARNTRDELRGVLYRRNDLNVETCSMNALM